MNVKCIEMKLNWSKIRKLKEEEEIMKESIDKRIENWESVDVSTLSDEELLTFYRNVRQTEGKLKSVINQYLQKYPFLRNIEGEEV